MTTKTKKKVKVKPAPTVSVEDKEAFDELIRQDDPVDYKAQLQSTIELSRAFIREVDNLMSSDLPPAQVGKILGDIVSGFNKQLDILDTEV